MNRRVVNLRALALAVVIWGCGGSASATLLDRGPDMVYDDVLNITWTRQAGDGLFDWAEAKTWAAGFSLGGFDDWRLPYASVSAGAGPTSTVVDCATASEVACRDNEMGYMFYYNLAGTFGISEAGNQTAVGGEQLIGISFVPYWSGTGEFSPLVWLFGFDSGGQGIFFEDADTFLGWAVRDGDVLASPVPEPATLILIGIGLLGLGFAQRKQQ